VPSTILVAIAGTLCAALGFVLAHAADNDVEARRSQLLEVAVEALQAVAPDLTDVDPKLIGILERASGLRGLRFEVEELDATRTHHPFKDRDGRVVGWLTWEPARAQMQTLMELVPAGAAIALGLIGFAGLALRRRGRLGPTHGSQDFGRAPIAPLAEPPCP
jgi:hypothetical protein